MSNTQQYTDVPVEPSPDKDGRRFPRRQDFLVRAEELCRHLKSQAHDFERPARRSVERDTGRISQFFENLDRGPTSGVAIFSSGR